MCQQIVHHFVVILFATGKQFLQKDMPIFIKYLHYRIIDVSTVKELTRRWYPTVFSKAPIKKEGHRAMEDIKESIDELKFYRKNVFVSQKLQSQWQNEASLLVELCFFCKRNNEHCIGEKKIQQSIDDWLRFALEIVDFFKNREKMVD